MYVKPSVHYLGHTRPSVTVDNNHTHDMALASSQLRGEVGLLLIRGGTEVFLILAVSWNRIFHYG